MYCVLHVLYSAYSTCSTQTGRTYAVVSHSAADACAAALTSRYHGYAVCWQRAWDEEGKGDAIVNGQHQITTLEPDHSISSSVYIVTLMIASSIHVHVEQTLATAAVQF